MGYSPHFVENYSQVVDILYKNEDYSLQVVTDEDSICKACPHQSVKGCAVEEKIQGLDARHGQILNLKPGDILSWKEAQQRLKDNMNLEAFHYACAGCEWKELGVCEAALRKLRAV